jgi:hypoxanthine phosphoribosyltransferase
MPDLSTGAAERLIPLISERRIRQRVGALASAIDADYGGEKLSLVAVLKGACIFAADLSRRIAAPATLDFIAAASYGSSTRPAGAVALDGLDQLELFRRHVLVIEDILDTGQTMRVILDRFRQQRPASLALCALLRKPAARDLEDLPAEYVGFDIDDEFVVGYGMDYAERYPNLPGVYRLILGDSG